VSSYRGKARAAAAAAALALVAVACGSSRGSSSSASGSSSAAASGSGSSSATAAPTTTSAPAVKFGTLDSPCGAGTAKGATDTGVTDTSIAIGYGDDAGFAAAPGLDHQMSDAMKAMIKWCNDQGGILGRTITGTYYDAALTQVNAKMQDACKNQFSIVGEGWALDNLAEQTRVGCNLLAVPGFAATPDFANGPMMYEGVPNPDDLTPSSSFYQLIKLFPDRTKLAFYHTTLASTESNITKAAELATAAGYQVIDCGVKVDYNGEPDYKPFAQKFKSCGAQVVFFNQSPGPQLENFLQAMDQVGVHPLYLTDTNDYTPELAAWNTTGLGDNIYSRDAFQPIENAALVPAVQAYVDAVKATGGSVDQLGQQSASSFLLWATAAKACASTLTRQCMINQLSQIHKWDAGGLHAVTDPGTNTPPQCGVLLKLTKTAFAQVYPTTQGQLDCDPKYLAKLSQANWGTTLGADRISTKYLGPNILKPQSS